MLMEMSSKLEVQEFQPDSLTCRFGSQLESCLQLTVNFILKLQRSAYCKDKLFLFLFFFSVW